MGPLVVAAFGVIAISAVCSSPWAPRFLSDAVMGAVRQMFWAAVLFVYVPVAWLYSLGLLRTGADREGLLATLETDPTRLMMSTGAAMVAAGYAYTKLPLDLIPDSIPLLGQLDDGVASAFMALGVLLALCGAMLSVSLQ